MDKYMARFNNVAFDRTNVFALIPKAMSSSIKCVCAQHIGVTDIRRVPRFHNKTINPAQQVFAIVRDPVERLRSYYADQYPIRKQYTPRGLSFEEFVAYQTERWADHAIIPQADRLEGLRVHIFRFEDNPWPKIQERIPGLPDLPRENVTTREKPHATANIKAMIRAAYKKDFYLYGY